jgi:ribonuclease BN (tRNA processing enzyme)
MPVFTVLGGSPAWPNPDQAASGYLLEHADRRVLIDCGTGIAGELRSNDPGPLTDILITHFHADHWFDLVPLHYVFRYGIWHDRPHPALHLPPGGRQVLDTVASVWDGSVETFEAAFEVTEYDPTTDLRMGELLFSFAPCRHYTTCYSVKIDTPGSTIVYSADTAPTERLARFAHGADLFICEASLMHGSDDSEERGHMDPAEAGREAARADVQRLLLTHVPAEHDFDQVRAMAQTEFTGPVEVARPGLRYVLNSS